MHAADLYWNNIPGFIVCNWLRWWAQATVCCRPTLRWSVCLSRLYTPVNHPGGVHWLIHTVRPSLRIHINVGLAELQFLGVVSHCYLAMATYGSQYRPTVAYVNVWSYCNISGVSRSKKKSPAGTRLLLQTQSEFSLETQRLFSACNCMWTMSYLLNVQFAERLSQILQSIFPERSLWKLIESTDYCVVDNFMKEIARDFVTWPCVMFLFYLLTRWHLQSQYDTVIIGTTATYTH